ncbi:BON domain-containing protein [Xenorhabdus cabanillasii]|uniref:Hyperosmotically inducible protein n=2 Tax=Xenorhabdus cabanillasii TaxID=351673 RepID=A0A3D9U9H3_9GAMM|nr:BON domain-containing protein [Xenorhabdus cabanillasii]PHM77360.1 osmotically inducible protein Y [Xenorhabdus cabanillasii JM26]REF26128.1 hyperosmotically inducible protein [Xenorhabdus cabanillasii]CDL85882.1 Osmotically inducible protein Y [Xenorhabdus cabanillasii JM26]
MKKSTFTHSLLSVVLGSVLSLVLISGSVSAAETSSGNAIESNSLENKILENTSQKIDNSIKNAAEKFDNSLKQVGSSIDDSVITAKIKEKLLEYKGINSNNISVKTEKGVVYLSGFVKNEEQVKRVIKIAHQVDGVKFVNSTLTIKK